MPRIASFAAVPVLVAVALGAAGGADTDSFARTAPFALITGVEHDPWCDEGDDAYVLDSPADLRGPHFSLSLGCLFRGDAVPLDLAAAGSDLEHVVPVEDGSEFLIAQVASMAEYEPELEADAMAVTAWIQAGGERIDLNGIPAEGRSFVLSVPVGEDAVLWVDDSGRAQGLDLRTGAQVEPIGSYYNGLRLSEVAIGGYNTGEIDVYNSRASGYVRCADGSGTAHRSVWREDLGWAAEGTVFLEVRFKWCSELESSTWELDRERAVTVDRNTPLSWTATELEGGWDHFAIVFAVPADADEITVDFTPYGEVENDESGTLAFAGDLPHFAWVAEF
ncbi:hypothetical protein [Glycomyces harbinensis]|uniref:Uncharacterized protein n=1 Tax=Glycomyces harbinensis TaxID=58114 RepID=A0A1G7BDZ8_9ACTN|nr:hypothetical protein [Glycomyces harbinensis]SDE24445.1 hypothetical protein SAMN05216270_11660 [Glycomyces harbinensis]